MYMRSFLSTLMGMFILLMISCSNTTSETTEEEVTHEEEMTATITEEENVETSSANTSSTNEARNVMINSMSVFTGTFFMAFNGLAEDMAMTISNAFSDALDAEEGEAKTEEIDAAIAKMDEETATMLGEMITKLNDAFDQMEEEDPELYQKLFSHEGMQEGVDIVKSYDLPASFPSFSDRLTTEEQKRYILYLSTNLEESENNEDPVNLMFADLMGWMETLDTAFNEDEEIKAFFESLK